MVRRSIEKYDLADLNAVLIKKAAKRQRGDVLNEILYGMAKKYPNHTDGEEIYAKVCIIGRTYAASLERGAGHDPKEGTFYWDKIIPALKKAKIDKLIEPIRNYKRVTVGNLPSLLSVHKELMNAISDQTNKKNRSFVSKYLHFHFRDLFFIYDSYAQEAIRNFTLTNSTKKPSMTDKSDKTYEAFCWKCLALHDEIQTRFRIDLTPRQLDNLLLGK